ncbi:DinB family protein [Stackebrandtia endophytica]|uniref:DinB family protein n=1 Tax=Stackebrandtia endophytica TaxID=1496996 RepID=UPI001476B134|nr:DinB family protein [Stackebrandtia endophytica]
MTIELIGWVQQSIERICGSVAGLTEAQVRQPAAPSGWTIAGLVGHIHDSSLFWLHNVIAGVPMTFNGDDEWNNDPESTMPQLLSRLRTDTARACDAIEQLAADAAPGWWPEGAWGGYRQETIRGVLLHLLYDNAAHTGHLDLARERIDGGVWDYGRDAVRRPDQR